VGSKLLTATLTKDNSKTKAAIKNNGFQQTVWLMTPENARVITG